MDDVTPDLKRSDGIGRLHQATQDSVVEVYLGVLSLIKSARTDDAGHTRINDACIYDDRIRLGYAPTIEG